MTRQSVDGSGVAEVNGQHARQQRHIALKQRLAIEDDPYITTLRDAIRAAGERPVDPSSGDAIILLDSQGRERRLSYAELWSGARTAAAGLRTRGVQEGDRILLLLPTSDAYITILGAAILLGAIPCTVAAPTSRSKTDEALRYIGYIYEKLDPTLVVVPAHLESIVRDYPAIDARRVAIPDELSRDGSLPADVFPAADPRQPLHIQLTSGSTSRPKGVILSHGNVIANVRAIASAVDYAPREESALSWLPLYHDMGLVQLLMAIYYQSTIVLMTPTAFLRNPLIWLQNMSRYRAALCAAPTFAYSLCVRKFDPTKLQGLDLSSWRRAFIGAEPVPLTILREFTRCYQPYGFSEYTMYPCYGMAETVLATTVVEQRPNRLFGFISCDRIDPEALRSDHQMIAAPVVDPAFGPALEVVGLGHAVQGLDLCVISPDGSVLPDRAVGEICVRGTSLMQGYFRDPKANAEAIKDGWYHTGDRGYLVDGELYVLGRIKELLIVRGRNYYPHDVEAVIEEHAQVRQGYAVVFGINNPEQGTDDVIAVIETKAAPEEHVAIAQQLQQSLLQTFGFTARDIVFVRHGSIPRTTSGKRQRVLSQEWYQAGKFGGMPTSAVAAANGFVENRGVQAADEA